MAAIAGRSPPIRFRRNQDAARIAAIRPSPNTEAPSMIHQRVAIPCADELSGRSESCFEPQPESARAPPISVTHPIPRRPLTFPFATRVALGKTVVQLTLIGLAVALYAAAVVRVRRRRGTVDWLRAASFGVGGVLLVVGALMPDETFALHMTQHLLIGDLAPLFVVLGLSGPLLRPALALRPVRALRVLAHPLVALPLWAINLGVWHIAPVFAAAVRHDGVHALQHLLFFTCGALLWSALLDVLPGPRWFRLPQRLGYLGVMWLVSLTL